jgi:thioredoxin 1
MATTALTPDTLYAQVESSGITLIDFWADWCGPCLNFAPIYEDVAKRFPAHAFAKVDTEEIRHRSYTDADDLSGRNSFV